MGGGEGGASARLGSVGRGYVFFFFNDTATPEIYSLSLHDALPIWCRRGCSPRTSRGRPGRAGTRPARDRKSTRLNSSHANISYAVFCLKKKQRNKQNLALKNTQTSAGGTPGARVCV